MGNKIEPHLLYANLYLSETLKNQLEENSNDQLYTIEEIEVGLAFKSAELKRRLEEGDPLVPFSSIEALQKGLDLEDEDKESNTIEDLIQKLIFILLWLVVIFGR